MRKHRLVSKVIAFATAALLCVTCGMSALADEMQMSAVDDVVFRGGVRIYKSDTDRAAHPDTTPVTHPGDKTMTFNANVASVTTEMLRKIYPDVDDPESMRAGIADAAALYTPAQIKNLGEGSKVPKPNDCYINGLVFEGWYKDAAGTTRWNFNEDEMPNANVVLYAKWRSLAEGETGAQPPMLGDGAEDPNAVQAGAEWSGRGQGDVDLAYAKIEIKNVSQHPVLVHDRTYLNNDVVAHLTTGEIEGLDGHTEHGEGAIAIYPQSWANEDKTKWVRNDGLPTGSYEAREVSVAPGRDLNTAWVGRFSITSEQQIVDLTTWNGKELQNTIWRGGIKFQKVDRELEEYKDTHPDENITAINQGDSRLEDAVFVVINESKFPVWVPGYSEAHGWAKPGDVCFRFHTDANGMYQSPANTFPYGTFKIVEEVESEGHLLNSDYFLSFKVREKGKIYDLTYEEGKCREEIKRGGIEIEKRDIDLNASEAMAGEGHEAKPEDAELSKQPATLEGVKFDIFNASVNPVIVDGNIYNPGDFIKQLETVWDPDAKKYVARSEADTFPYGTYAAREFFTLDQYGNKLAVPSYKVTHDGATQVTLFAVREHGVIVTGGLELHPGGTNTDAVSRSLANEVKKTWGETIHKGSLDKHGEHNYVEAKPVGITNAFITQVQNKTKETQAAAKTVLGSDNAKKIQSLDWRSDHLNWIGKSKDFVANAIWFNEIVRGDFRFEKHAADTHEPMETIWLVTNVASGERHVIKTDKNGVYDSSSKYEGCRHSYNTNTNDHLLEKIDNGEMIQIDEAALCGIWFGMGEDGDPADPTKEPHWVAVNDELGAFPSGEYRVQEVRTDTNQGYGLIDWHLYITFDKITVAGGTRDDHVLSISTVATDKDTGIHAGIVSRDSTIVDTVNFYGLETGAEYSLRATLMDADTGSYFTVLNDKREPITVGASKKFMTTADTGSVNVEINIKGGDLAGKNIVVFEDLFDKTGNLIATHRDILDEDQTIAYPKIKTLAQSVDTDSHSAPIADEITIKDTVTFENLTPGYNYSMAGRMIDTATGKEIPALRANVGFMPKQSKGTVDVMFTFSSKELSGKTLVVYEELVYNNNTLVKHEDVNDAEQQIGFPAIRTEATFGATGSNMGYAMKSAEIDDKVYYSGLVPGATYELTACLADKATGNIIQNGNDVITGKTTFTAQTSAGIAHVIIPFDASKLTGRDIVVFETLSYQGNEVVRHEDINDDSQTIHFVGVTSNLTFTESGVHEGVAGVGTSVTEQVQLTNLAPNQKYTLKVSLVDRHSGGLVQPVEGVMTKTIEITPDASTYEDSIVFEFDSTGLEGHDIVAVDELLYGGKTAATHDDLNDLDQTIHFVKLGTTLMNADTGNHTGVTKDGLKLIDTVAFTGLRANETYRLEGVLVDSVTAEPICEPVTKEFSPEAEIGETTVEFTIDARKLGGKNIVAFERLYKGSNLIGVHEDLNDDAQTVRFPGIVTKLTAADTGAKNMAPSEFAYLVDEVSYSGLTPGQTYKLKGEIVQQNGTPIKYQDKEVVTEYSFTPITRDGVATLNFMFDSSDMAGQYVVCYETLYSVIVDEEGKLTDVEICAGRDLGNAEQTVKFVKDGEVPDVDPNKPVTDGPTIATQATCKDTGTKMLALGDKVTIVDKVHHEKLPSNVEYELRGTLVYKDTGNVFTQDGEAVVATKKFVPSTNAGDQELEFTINTTGLTGQALVVYEELYRNGELVCEHKDLKDEAQTVYMATIKTVATGSDGKSKNLKPGEKTDLIDTVTFANLVPGEEYQLQGRFIDKETGEAVTDFAVLRFTPQSSGGSQKLNFVIDTRNMNGRSLVCFEKLYDGNGKLLAVHEDLKDSDQTVMISSKYANVETGGGESSMPAIIGIVATLLIATGAGVAWWLYDSKKKKKFEHLK